MTMKILIISDKRVSRQALREMLDDEYDVLEAANQAEAVDASHPSSIASAHAALLAMGARTASALALLEETCDAARAAATPLIVVAEKQDAELEGNALAMGASDFVAQPFTANVVKARLQNAVEAAQTAERLRAEKESRRISEEQLRIAVAAGDRAIAHYDIKTGVYRTNEKTLLSLGYGDSFANMPQALVEKGVIAPECVDEYLDFYDKLKRGESCSADTALVMENGDRRWFKRVGTVIRDDRGRPAQATIVFTDITDQREKEAAYRRWQQSLQQKALESYTLYRGNLSKGTGFIAVSGELPHVMLADPTTPFDAITLAYASQFVHQEDRESFVAALHSDTLLAHYHRNRRNEFLEYREIRQNGAIRWMRLTIDLSKYPDSPDIEAYLMFEDIDASKTVEMKEQALTEIDPLTGVLNQAAFAQRMDRILTSEKMMQHALLMLDMNHFKLLNETFGRAAGDEALTEAANSLRTLLRRGDLLGRLDGDEFIICMRNIPYDAAIEKKARQLCAQARKAFSPEVQMSASIGIAVYPRDGQSFEALRRSADAALYAAKKSGEDGFAFYCREKDARTLLFEATAARERPWKASGEKKPRILIVDSSTTDAKLFAGFFKGEAIVDTTQSSAIALARLRRFGVNYSVMLLDLDLPNREGFAIMEQMRDSVEMRSIPIIALSNRDDREAALRAIRCGAADFVTKPVDPDLIRLRAKSAISKSENERLRAQNSYLVLQSSEEARYRTVLESTGTVVIEYDWLNGVFIYDPSISKHIAGNYDDRKLWQTLMSDMVADALDVKAMQELVHGVADDRLREDDGMTVKLKTPSGSRQWFRMRAFKQVNEHQITDKIIITFANVNDEVMANERLRFQAERDPLTSLYNRITFFEKATEMIAAHEPGYYLMSSFDIDNFKVINDQYGSEKGDDILRQIAEIAKDEYDRAKGIVGRISADNFVGLHPRDYALSNNFEELSPAVILGSSAPPLSFSVGRYLVDDPSLSASAMYDRATLAKTSVKGRYDAQIAHYNESMLDCLLHEQQIVNEMNPALADRQFEVWLQPQYNHATGALVGAEALARWRHPVKGLVVPDRFIPVFERNGFIYELDKCVWQQACALLRRWIDEGRAPLPVSVNVSRYDVYRDDLIEVIMGLVRTYDVPIDLLHLEITESAFAKSTEQIVNVVKKLINRGFTVEIDDFGSGYSSLNTLKDVPAQVLKLDLRFLENSGDPIRSSNVLESIVRMAQRLGMTIVAEGVETVKQADYLKSIGCIYVQGYLYAKPMPADAYETLAVGVRKERR